MSFKDDLRRDLDAVFFSFEGFTELHELNGVILPSTERRYTERLTERQSEDYDGLNGEQVSVQFRSADFIKKAGALPKEKERVRYDGKWYDVKHSEDEYGGCRLELASQRGRYG